MWVKNNDRRPNNEGVYKTINTDRNEQLSYFDGRHWIINVNDGEEPVVYWFDDEPCEWKSKESVDGYKTNCGKDVENFKFCPGCGRKIKTQNS